MNRPWRCLLLAGVALAAWCPSALAARSPICTHGLVTVEVDPRGLLPLTGTNPIGSAIAAALHRVSPASRPQVTGAILAVDDVNRGTSARVSCGARVWRRTVVVYITARAMLPAQSASQGVFFVGRFKSGYRVWQVVH